MGSDNFITNLVLFLSIEFLFILTAIILFEPPTKYIIRYRPRPLLNIDTCHSRFDQDEDIVFEDFD